MPSEYNLIGVISSAQPQLGDGFDPLDSNNSPGRKSAITFQPDDETLPSPIQSGFLSQVDNSVTTASSNLITLSGGIASYVAGKFMADDEESFYSHNTVFSVFAKVVTRQITAKNPTIANGVDLSTAGAFRDKYGAQFVSVVEYGGLVCLLFRFSTVDTTTKNTINASLSVWQSSANLSLGEVLSQHNVTTAWGMQPYQVGGTVPMFTGTDLPSFRQFLDMWVPTITGHADLIAIQTVDYESNIPHFSFNLPSGFGDGS